MKLRGEWIVPGEPIVVIGYAEAHEFVEGTGGHRAAIWRVLAGVLAKPRAAPGAQVELPQGRSVAGS